MVGVGEPVEGGEGGVEEGDGAPRKVAGGRQASQRGVRVEVFEFETDPRRRCGPARVPAGTTTPARAATTGTTTPAEPALTVAGATTGTTGRSQGGTPWSAGRSAPLNWTCPRFFAHTQ